MIQDELLAYNRFLHTGKIEDYLGYCQTRHPLPQAKEAVSKGATYVGGHYPPPIQNGKI